MSVFATCVGDTVHAVYPPTTSSVRRRVLLLFAIVHLSNFTCVCLTISSTYVGGLVRTNAQ